jgi:hypothetical protein
MLNRHPTDLPRFLAALAGASLLAWGFAAIAAEASIGRPSSTAGLAYIFIPAWAAMLAFGGFVIGLIVRAVLPGEPRRTTPVVRGAAWVILASVPLFAAWQGYAMVEADEEQARPRVSVSSPRVARTIIPVSARPAVCRPSELIRVRDASPAPDRASNDRPLLVLDGLSATFELGGRRSAPVPLSALDYLTSAYLLSLDSQAGTQAYVTVINGRATGRRSVVAVLSRDLEVLHTELVERSWQLVDNPLCAEESEGSGTATALLTCAGYRYCASENGIRFRLAP